MNIMVLTSNPLDNEFLKVTEELIGAGHKLVNDISIAEMIIIDNPNVEVKIINKSVENRFIPKKYSSLTNMLWNELPLPLNP